MALGGQTGGGGSAGGVRAGKAHVEIGADDSKLRSALKNSFAWIGKQTARLASIGAGVGGAGVAGGAALFGMALPTLKDIGRMDAAGKALGLTGEQASGLLGALGQYSDVGENIEGLTQFSQKIQDAFNGIGEEPKKLFEGLSVSAQELIDLPLDEKFYRIHDAIRQLPQEQQQFKLSMLGGTDSMKKWLPLLSMSNQELREQAAAFSLSNDEMAAAGAANRSYQQAAATLNRAWQGVAVWLAPWVESVAKGVSEWVAPLRSVGSAWDILKTRMTIGWVQLENVATEYWEFLKGGFRSGLYVVQNLWLDFADFMDDLGAKIGKALVTNITGGVNSAFQFLSDKLKGVAPDLSLKLGVAGMVANVAGANVAGGVDRQNEANRKANQDERNRLQKELQAADDAAAREQGRRQQALADELARLRGLLAGQVAGAKPAALAAAAQQQAARVSAVTQSVGGFDFGSFASQAFGTRGVGVQQKQLDVQQKQLDVLQVIRGLIAGGGGGLKLT